MRQQLPIQRGVDECCREGIVYVDWCSEIHSATPTRRSLRMNSGENHPPASEASFDDCCSSVGILANNRTPAGKLRAVFPVLIERLSSRNANRYRCLADTPS